MLEIKFKKRYRDYNKGDVIELIEVAAQYGTEEQKMLTRLLSLDVIEFPGKRILVKPAKKKIAAKKPAPKGSVKKPEVKKKTSAKKTSVSVSKPKTATKKTESSSKKEVSNGL